MPRSHVIRIAFLGCLVGVVAGDCNDSTGIVNCASLPQGRIVTFNLTESGTTNQSQLEPCAFDPQTVEQGACDLIVWDFDGANTFFQFLAASDPMVQCGLDFSGRLVFDGSQYEFVGLRQRLFGTGSGPFATGTYEQRDGGGNVVATGQFEFSE